MGENALTIRNLTKRYGNFTLENLNLTLSSGCILGLIGENGAGKSTMIKAILGAIHPDEGQIEVLGCDNAAPEFIQKKEEIGVVMDEACFPSMLNAQQVNQVMKNIYANWEEELFFSYIKKFQLPLKKPFKDFSRGMKMKLSIAAALSHGAKLLILDEATSGLDPVVRDEILEVFNDFTREEDHSILISSHIISDLEKICDYIAFIHRGKLLFCEEKDRLLEEYGLLKISAAEFEAIDENAVIASRNTGYGIEAVVKKDCVPEAFVLEKISIENIMLAMAKEAAA